MFLLVNILRIFFAFGYCVNSAIFFFKFQITFALSMCGLYSLHQVSLSYLKGWCSWNLVQNWKVCVCVCVHIHTCLKLNEPYGNIQIKEDQIDQFLFSSIKVLVWPSHPAVLRICLAIYGLASILGGTFFSLRF